MEAQAGFLLLLRRRTGPVIDLSDSPAFNQEWIRVIECLIHWLQPRKLKGFMVEPPQDGLAPRVARRLLAREYWTACCSFGGIHRKDFRFSWPLALTCRQNASLAIFVSRSILKGPKRRNLQSIHLCLQRLSPTSLTKRSAERRMLPRPPTWCCRSRKVCAE